MDSLCVSSVLFCCSLLILAAHQLGGFKVGVGFSLRKCRNCLATAEQMNEFFHHHLFLSRSPELHEYHCSLISGGCLSDFNSITYGVNYCSNLNDISLFHVADWQLPQDIMHILLEGVLPLELKLLLTHLTSNNFFTISHLNTRIMSFQYGRANVTTKPSTIDATHLSQNGKLRQSASQCWTLGRYLPLIIGDLVPIDDINWRCFLYLHDILGICMSPCISAVTISYLSELIAIHHKVFRECYSSVNITPKLHYLIHIPEQIRRFGPPVRYWCMRMEAKNAYSIKAATCGNLKNIYLSFAMHHQCLLSFNLSNPHFLTVDITGGPAPMSLSLQQSSPDIITGMKSLFPDIDTTVLLHRPKWIDIGSTHYEPNSIIVQGCDGILPLFGVITDLYNLKGKPVARITKYQTLGLNEHNLCYVVSKVYIDSSDYFQDLLNLYDYSVLYANNSFSQTDSFTYICLKWNNE